VQTCSTARFDLSKACLLVALEEEAAAEEAVQYGRCSANTGRSDLGTASTWNLTRLQALVDEVHCLLDLRGTRPLDAPEAPHGWDAAQGAQQGLRSPGAILGSAAGADSSGAPSDHAGGSGHQGPSMDAFPLSCVTAVNDVLFGMHGYRRMEHHGDPR
jgi:hypothetical protein